MRRALLLAALLLTCLAAPRGLAQPAPTANLVADSVRLQENSVLVAEGDVQVFYDGAVLTAPRLSYDREGERLEIDGPIRLTDGPRSVILADSAALDTRMRNGILRSARLVLEGQLQIAAKQAARVGGRYVQLTNSIASSCEICAGGTPTWEIRARKVIHDRQERVIHFDRATFRLYGLPVAYFPKLTMPDPGLRRKSGFLLPRFASNSRLGFGIKAPFFLTLGPHADLTFTPFLSPRTRTLEGRYRQTLSFGALNLQGAVSRDDLREDDLRWYVFGEGAFVLPRDFRLDIALQSVSDDAYIFDYDYDDQDRLTNEVLLTRAGRDELVRARLSDVTTLRGRERAIRDRLPSRVTDIAIEQRLPAGGGELRLGFDAGTIHRESEAESLGRDMRTLGASLAYHDRRVGNGGMVLSSVARVEGQIYRTRQDPDFDAGTGRISGGVSTEARLPLQKTGAGGTRHLLEPVLQFAWSDRTEAEVPNEDSVLVEFDEGNLLSLGRFPGDDETETGARGTLGLSYAARLPAGHAIDLTLGRIYRTESQSAFAPGTGLAGRRSDWLAASRLRFGAHVELIGRALFDSSLDTRQSEARLTYSRPGFNVGSSFSWIDSEPLENRPDDIAELRLFGGFRLGRHWSTGISGHYDFTERDAARAALSLRYRTECLDARLGLSRRFTETRTIRPKTTVGFEVELVGFGAGDANEAYRRTCNG